jgi:hypothetical protein
VGSIGPAQFAVAQSPNRIISRADLMRSELHEKIFKVGVILFVFVFSVFAGKMMGNGRFGVVIALLAAVLAVVVVGALKERIWVLIPCLWLLDGQVPISGYPLGVRDFVVLFVAAAAASLMAFKIMNAKAEIRWIDALVIANLVYLVTLFIRNPTGLEFLGSEIVGGRPYFNVFIAFLAYFVIGRVRLTESLAKLIPACIMISLCLVGALNLISEFFPGAGDFLIQFYSGIDFLFLDSSDSDSDGENNRRMWVLNIGRYGVLYLCAYAVPIRIITLAQPFKFLLLGLCFYLILSTGFRNILLWAVFAFLVSSYFQSGFVGSLKIALLGSIVVAVVILGHDTLYKLPFSIQRSLSFVPGVKWDSSAVQDAEGSIDWRIEIWKDVFFSDRYIRDRTFGDGFGFTRYEYEYAQAIRSQRVRSTADTRTIAAMTGDYHSGPLTTLKTAGYLGGTLFLLTMFAASYFAATVIRRARGGPFYAVALFVGIPIVFEPAFYIFIFGKFENALPSVLFGVAMLRVIERSLAPVSLPQPTEVHAKFRPLSV